MTARAMNIKQKEDLLKNFNVLYPSPKSELVFNSPFELLICVVLSAQCTDKKVNEVTPALFKRFSSFERLAQARLTEVETIIRPVNYYRTKSRNIIALAKLVLKEFNGEIPLDFDDITSLPGVGRKTASVVLGELGAEFTLPVDTHVFRLSKRLGLATGDTPNQVEQELRLQFKPNQWRNLHHYLILHGRRVCKARNPLCKECTLLALCPSGSVA